MPFGISAGTALAIGAGVSAAGSIVGGIMQKGAVDRAASKAAELQAQGRDDAVAALKSGQTDSIAAYRASLDRARADLEPWRNQGGNALTVTSNLAGANGPEAAQLAQQDFFTSPGYQFRLDEGMRNVDAGAAARGMLRSGATLKEEQKFAQGLASQEFGDYYNRLYQLSGLGANAAQQTGGYEMQTGRDIGSAYLGTAGRLAGAYTGTAQDMANTEVSRGGAEASIYGNMAQGVGSAANSYIGNNLYNDRTNALLQQQQPYQQWQPIGGTW